MLILTRHKKTTLLSTLFPCLLISACSTTPLKTDNPVASYSSPHPQVAQAQNYAENPAKEIKPSITKRAIKRAKGTKAFFGDKENNTIVVVDIDKMEHLREVSTGHSLTYTTDKIGDGSKAYAVNRGSNAIDVIDTNSMEITKTIKLQHTPRSAEAENKTLQLCAVSGMNKAMISIISSKTDEVVAVVGDPTITQPVNNHGPHATGHPFWLDAHHFILIDRKKQKIFTYHIQQKENNAWQTTLLNSVDTIASAHQIIPRKGRYFGDKNKFYLTVEGSDTHYPMIMELQLVKGVGLVKTRELEIYKKGSSTYETHVHHGDFHPKKKLIYVGSKEGNFFIVNYQTMQIVKTFKAGKGAGHTAMIPQKNLAIIINHKDRFITVVDTKTDEKIKDILVSGVFEDFVGRKTIQAHPKYHASKDGKYFYAFLTEEGAFYRVDLDKLELDKRLIVGGHPAQGSFITN